MVYSYTVYMCEDVMTLFRGGVVIFETKMSEKKCTISKKSRKKDMVVEKTEIERE